MMKIRPSTKSDLEAMLGVEAKAFGESEGAEVVEFVSALMDDPSAEPRLSLLAILDDKAVGHILFTRAALEPAESSVSAAILAPLAVVPENQFRGIGSQLVRAGLQSLSQSGVELVFVLGHPEYYPRFGFKPAGELGFEAPYPIPEDVAGAWMVQELTPGVIGRVRGKVVCADAMNNPAYWPE